MLTVTPSGWMMRIRRVELGGVLGVDPLLLLDARLRQVDEGGAVDVDVQEARRDRLPGQVL